MERYKSDDTKELSSRVNKNNSLYEEIKNSDLSRVKSNDNVRVLESDGKTIDLTKIRKYLEENKRIDNTNKRRVIVPDDIKEEENKSENIKDYDINSVLENAKKDREIDYDRERYKKLKTEEYDILERLNKYEKEEIKFEKEDFNTEEKTLIDLINTVTIHKGEVNLLEDLLTGDDEKTLPIEEERELSKSNINVGRTSEIPIINQVEDTNEIERLERTKELVNLKEKTMELDNSFYTSSMNFSKEDFEGFDELEKSVKKNSLLTVFLLIILIIFIIATLVIIANYVFELGLF